MIVRTDRVNLPSLRTRGERRVLTGRLAAAMLALSLVVPAAALAQDAEESKDTWEHTADLSYVLTSGNSEQSTIGFAYKAVATWDHSSLEIGLGGIKADTTTTTRTAYGNPTTFTVDEQSSTETTAENYFFAARYDHTITEKLFWFAGANWLRNEFAGIRNRYVGEGGVGNAWRDDDHMKFKTYYALSYTDQDDLIPSPGADNKYIGYRLAYEYDHNLGENTTYTSNLVFNGNLEESSNWFSNFLNSVTVNMSTNLALKASLLLLYNNQPALTSVPLFDTPGGTQIGTVNVPLDELDTIFTTSLVIKF